MVKNTVLITLLWVIGRFVYGIEYGPIYEGWMFFCESRRVTLLAYGVLGPLVLVGGSLAMREFGLYSAMFLVDKALLRLSQFAVCLVAVAAVIARFDFQANVWTDLGPIALLPFGALAGATVSLYFFDFNYPIKESLVKYLGLTVLSWVIVWGGGFLPF